jgi:hypothetical protein
LPSSFFEGAFVVIVIVVELVVIQRDSSGMHWLVGYTIREAILWS